MRLTLAPLLLCAPLLMSAATAEDPSSYQSLWNEVASDPDCTPSQYPDTTLFTCETKMTLWYFTKANHPANPGVIERKLHQDKDGISVHEDGWSFAPDSGQPAFQAWMSQIKALDEKVRHQFQQHRVGGQ
jgi:hypothetical protein